MPRLCPGGTVVCLAGGPSLTAEDVNYVRGKATVIAVKDAYRLAPWADVLYGADAKWWTQYAGVPSFAGLKYAIQRQPAVWPDPHRVEFQAAGVSILRNTGDYGIEMQPTGLRTGRNSGYQVVNAAVHLGASRIVLLGYDMQVLPGQPPHWFGEHPYQTRSTSPYATFCHFFAGLVEPLRALSIEIVNCSRQTALECFRRAPLAEVL